MKMEVHWQEKREGKRRGRGLISRIGEIRKSSIIISLTLMFVLTEIITVTAGRLHFKNRYNGLEDIGDYDDLDQGASAPYQNQEGDGGQNTDSYGDNEPGKLGSI